MSGGGPTSVLGGCWRPLEDDADAVKAAVGIELFPVTSCRAV
jgi:hypothetical protein